MKCNSKYNAGFTLVELVVAMAMAVIVTAAATSVLLMGLRVNRQTADTASQQITVRSLLSVMENVAADGNISNVESDIIVDNAEKKYGSWVLKDKSDKAIFRYDVDDQTIYINEIAVLEGVYASNAIMEGQLLSISIETKDGIYTSSIYCRTAASVADPEVGGLPGDNTNVPGRDAFIQLLKSQYRSRGEIRVDGKDSGEYYSEWYIGLDYDDDVYDNGWNAKTPWCACYVSWALDKAEIKSPVSTNPRWFANVDDFMDYFQKKNYGDHGQSWISGGNKPTPGDLIFFDWNKGDNPQHVGVVLSVKEEAGRTTVYTIEGNSAGRVTIRSYSINDPRIIGYGVIWPN